MDILCTQDSFTPILDLWIQQCNFLFLKSAYDSFSWVREYINQEEKLKRLGTNDFYRGYFEDLRSHVDIRKPEEILSLLRFAKDSESAREICSEMCCQFLMSQPSHFFVYKYRVFGDILYKLFQHWRDKRIASVVMEYVSMSHMILDILNAGQSLHGKLIDENFRCSDEMIVRHASYRMFSEYKFSELEEVLQYNCIFLINYAENHLNDESIIQEIAKNIEMQRIGIVLVKQISTEVYIKVKEYIEK